MPIEAKDIAGLSKPFTRFIEVCSRGLGRLTAAHFIRTNAKADAEKVALLADALHAASKPGMVITYQDDRVSIEQQPLQSTLPPIYDPTLLEDRARMRVAHRETIAQENIEAITSTAAEELIGVEVVSETSPDSDWIARFFGAAEQISSEQMRALWGKILAGEIVKPGSYSLATLDFMRNLRPHHAALIEQVGKFALDIGTDSLIAIEDELWLSARGLQDHHHFKLGELGVLYPTNLAMSTTATGQPIDFIYRAKSLCAVIKCDESFAGASLPMWAFTDLGREVLGLVTREDDEACLEGVARFYLRNGAREALIGRVLNTDGDRVEVKTIRLITL